MWSDLLAVEACQNGLTLSLSRIQGRYIVVLRTLPALWLLACSLLDNSSPLESDVVPKMESLLNLRRPCVSI